MLANYFRTLFENERDGIVQSGCIFDRSMERYTNFIYAAGSYSQNYVRQEQYQSDEYDIEILKRQGTGEVAVDLFVLASYSLSYIRRLFVLLEQKHVKTVILPYLTPIQRLMIAECMPNAFGRRKEMIQFLDAPYHFLKEKNVEHIYLLYENGTPISNVDASLTTGIHFEAVDETVQNLVDEMEGVHVPVVHAGYIFENQWIFYFGVYGPDITQISKLVREKWKEEIDQGKVGEATELFLKSFGRDAYGSIVMYHGPLYDHPTQIKSMMTGKVFHSSRSCMSYIPNDGSSCSMACQYHHDHDVMQNQKKHSFQYARYGTLLLGNINLKRYFSDIAMRFWEIRNQVRAIGLPNCCVEEYWNSQILKLIHGSDMIYWVCPVRKYTSTRALLQIITESSFNRLIQVNAEYGFCISGYLVPYDEENQISN